MKYVVFAAAALIAAIVPQQRDVPAAPVPVATGEIAGIVWSADQTPVPTRRVVVSVSGGGMPGVRSVMTDDAGRFSFKKLPAGTFTVTARKAAFLAAANGSAKPGRPGSPIVLAAGQRVDVSLTLFKGAVITGTLRDASGLPVAGVLVAAADARTVNNPNGFQSETAVSDDRGSYRIYGLMPGDYLVTATPSPGGSGVIGSRSAAEMDALLATLSQRQNRPGVSSPPPVPPPSVGFSPIYYPGTALYTEAATVHLGSGDEMDASFVVSHVPVASIKGTISGDVMNLASVQLSVIIGGPRVSGSFSTGGITSTPPNTQGEFSYGNLPPGQYRIVARARRGASEPNTSQTGVGSSMSMSAGGGRGTTPAPGGAPTPNVEQLYAVADVEVRGQDVNGVHLSLAPGGTMSGKIVFDAASAPIPVDLTTIRVSIGQLGGSYMASSGGTVIGTSLSSVPAVAVKADGTFQIIGIGPSSYAVACQLPASLMSVWKLRSAIVDGRDLLDTNVDGPAVQLSGVTLVLSDKRTELSGSLLSGPGKTGSDFYVIAFSTNASDWRTGARRSLSARPDNQGRFIFADLPSGDYYLAALTDLDPIDWQTSAFLEQIVPAAIKVSVAEGEKKVQDLRIR